MPEFIEVSNQAELDKALERPGVVPVLVGNGRFIFWGSSSPSIVARGSSSPSIVARESSSPSIEARESSSPSIEAWESSSPSIVAWGSSSPSIVAWESSSPSIEAWESSSPSIEVAATAAAILKAWGTKKLKPVIAKGGQLIKLPKPDLSTAEKWCAYYGLEPADGIVTLYKAVGDNYRSHWGMSYTPGSEPRAPDWDGGKAECGGGLHFSPSPGHAREFDTAATRYVACPVKLADIATHPNGVYPQKVKAPGVGGPVWEVDRHGKPVQVGKKTES